MDKTVLQYIALAYLVICGVLFLYMVWQSYALKRELGKNQEAVDKAIKAANELAKKF